MANAIEIRELTKFYARARGIEGVTFDVREGEMFGFIGPNGAGKSTTIRLLLSLIFPTSGSAQIFGRDCFREAPEIARRVGYLPSEVFYYDGMRVRDLLRYSASFYKRDCSARIRALAERMDLDLARRIDDLSYGNKKKVGIVQGLLHQPDLIILDEPTSGLDPIMQQTFFDLLREENRRGATVLMSSHILSEVQRLCDRVAIIKDGRLEAYESIAALTRNSHKRFRFELPEEVPADIFQLDGVSGLAVERGVHSFLYQGDLRLVLERAAGVPVHNLSVDESSLEEIFLHYYR